MKKGSSVGGPLQGDLFGPPRPPEALVRAPAAVAPLAEPLPAPVPAEQVPPEPVDVAPAYIEPEPIEPPRPAARAEPVVPARPPPPAPPATPVPGRPQFVPRAAAPTPAAAAPPPRLAPEVRPRPARQVISVGELTRQIKWTLERGFPQVCVRGEVSGFRGPNVRGHLYFSLKDADACIDAKVWASTASRMKFKLRDGLEVVVEASVDVFEPQGRYSLIIQRIEPAGEGALALAFQQLKERLMAEGLIGDRRIRPPRPIPFLPRRIGVVTSTTGAALRDFLRVLHQRHPRLSVLVCDARVQGDGAADEVVSAIERLSRTDVDVIVVTRGGGSIEDLWTFNEERVARAIFASPIPVVSAIGHEVDFTIADFVADYRAPTPSAAAEKLSPVLSELELSLATAQSRLRRALERRVIESRQRVERLRARIADPRRILGQKRLRLSADAERLARAMRREAAGRRERQKELSDRLARQRPDAKLRERHQQVLALSRRMRAAMAEALRRMRSDLQPRRSALLRASPALMIREGQQRLQGQAARMTELQRGRLALCGREFHKQVAKLDAMNPLAVLARGYAVAFRADGRVVRGHSDVSPGDALSIRMARERPNSLAECDVIEATVTASSPGAENRGQASFSDTPSSEGEKT